MNTNDDIEPVVVFSGNIWHAEMVRSLLENAEIESFLIDGNTGTLAPWYTAGGGAGSVKIVVSNLDLKQAGEVVVEFEKNIREGD